MTVTNKVAKSEGNWYWLRKEGEHGIVRKYIVNPEDGSVHLEAIYEIEGGKFCSCPQMKFRSDVCKHVKMLDGALVCKPVDVEVARKVARAVVEELKDLADQMVVPDDWAEKDQDKKVTKVKLKSYAPKHEILKGKLIGVRDEVMVEIEELPA